MLYQAYQAQNDVLMPIRLMAEAARGFWSQPWPLIGNHPVMLSYIETGKRFPSEPLLHVRLVRVGAPNDRKTVALRILRDKRYYQPVR